MDSGTMRLRVGHRRRQEGFTLIEVMVALGILAFGILAIASMQTASLGGTNLAGNVTESSTLAMDRIERLIATSYNNSDLSAGSHPSTPIVQGKYTISWFVTVGQLFTNTKTIQVTVQWSEKGAPKSTGLTYVKMDVV